MKRTEIKQLLQTEAQSQQVLVKGWVRTFRNTQFIALNDGSTLQNLQVVVDFAHTPEEILNKIKTGACLSIVGKLVPSSGAGQAVEVAAEQVEILGECDAEAYPISPKKHSLEFLRSQLHLRMRTNTFGAVFRVRHAMAYAVHKYFNDKGYFYIHTPIITGSDAEGAGEMFRVTTLNLANLDYSSKQIETYANEYYGRLEKLLEESTELQEYKKDLENQISSIQRKTNRGDLFPFKNLKELILCNSSCITKMASLDDQKDAEDIKLFKNLANKIQDLRNKIYETPTIRESFFGTNSVRKYDFHFSDGEAKNLFYQRTNNVFTKKHKTADFFKLSFVNFKKIDELLRISNDRKVEHENDFFGKETNLTVSGQLQGEISALALGKIYTFGPTFRAENSNTTRHLAEFWMIEPEVAFYDIHDNKDLAEDFLKYLIRYALENCAEDVAFLDKRLAEEEKQKPQQERRAMGLIETLNFCIENDFARITYTEAIDILQKSKPYKEKKFQYEVAWGKDLQSEHERYLVEKHFKKPVIVGDYPQKIKAFYMRENTELVNGEKTVAAMDVLFPGIGEIIGGSQREDRTSVLQRRMEEMHIPVEEMSWYLDLRRFGSAPHSGFGLGFERLLLFVTGMGNIRDVIGFPRAAKQIEY